MSVNKVEFAFPSHVYPSSGGGSSLDSRGITLRDYLAAKAMEGMIVRGDPISYVPGWAYEMADAMLEARK